ncbi:hypothetical protein D9Q98_003211 [Chlorella vulgaris]|uniref:Nucleotide exchange factor Fes1 domain-containing protein n=1 Tax=Chlorella vulgaris TaxID=3077 RepID=A0A9D4TSK1_CHLVU|nr:hypothetical protein D9Q98_003211 [Chlorella vulgaris]
MAKFRLPAVLLALALAGLTMAAANGNDSAQAAAEPITMTAAPIGGGSQEDVLKWALAHSDPDALRRAAAEARAGAEAGSDEYLEKRGRVQDLLEAMKGEPSEAHLLREAVGVLSAPGSTQCQVGDALEALRYLVEPIDAANDLQRMGGLAPVVALLHSRHPPALQAKAAHLLGTAASNNLEFQEALLAEQPEVLPLLLQLLGDGGASSGAGSGGDEQHAAAAYEASAKALYCLSTILRLNSPARAAFYRAAGVQTLQLLLVGGGRDLRLQRKALTLLTDLVHLDAPALAATTVTSILQLLDAHQHLADPDLTEKALLAILALLDSSAAPAAAKLLASVDGPSILARLASRLQTVGAEDADAGDSLLGLLSRVQAAAAGQAAAASAGVALAGAARESCAAHDATEL